MVFGDSEESGIRRGDEFYHGPLDLYMSSANSWEIINTPNSLIFNAPFGEAVLQMTLEDLNFREEPEEYLKRFAQNVLEEEDLSINGFKGYSVKAIQSGKITRMAVIFKQNQVYQFIGFLKDERSDFSKFDVEFKEIIKSFRKLNEDEIAYSKPLRISSYEVKQGDTYKSLALKSSININAEDQLRLINGDYPNKPLTPGRIIKLVK